MIILCELYYKSVAGKQYLQIITRFYNIYYFADTIMQNKSLVLVYTAGSQLWKVRMVCYGIYILSPVLVWAGFLVINAPPDPVQHGEAAEYFPLLFGVLFILLAFAFSAGIAVYQYCYVSKISHDAADGMYIFETELPFSDRQTRLSLSDIKNSAYQHGQYEDVKFTINAPWYKIKIQSRRFAFIVDMQGEIMDEKLFGELIQSI